MLTPGSVLGIVHGGDSGAERGPYVSRIPVVWCVWRSGTTASRRRTLARGLISKADSMGEGVFGHRQRLAAPGCSSLTAGGRDGDVLIDKAKTRRTYGRSHRIKARRGKREREELERKRGAYVRCEMTAGSFTAGSSNKHPLPLHRPPCLSFPAHRSSALGAAHCWAKATYVCDAVRAVGCCY